MLRDAVEGRGSCRSAEFPFRRRSLRALRHGLLTVPQAPRGRPPLRRFLRIVALVACLARGFTTEAAEEPLYEQRPFDQITLNKSNDYAVLKVKPLAFPDGKPPAKPRPTEKLQVELIDSPGKAYELEWRSIERIEFFDELVLAKALEVAKAGQVDQAYDYFKYLEAKKPRPEGLDAAIEEFYFEEAKAQHRLKQYDVALAMLQELHRRNPKRSGLDAALGATTDRLVEQQVAAGNVPAARRLVRNLATSFPQHPVIARWHQTWQQQAATLMAEAKAAIEGGDLVRAEQSTRQLARVWPALPGGKELAEAVHAKYPRLIVGVTSPAMAFEPGRINDWAARRSTRLVFRALAEYLGPSSEGGRYVCPVGQWRQEDLHRRLVIQLRPGLHWSGSEEILTGYELSRRLLAMADPADPGFSPPWAEIFEAVSVRDVYAVRVSLRRPHVRPEALLNTILAPATWSPGQPLPTNGPYMPLPRSGENATYRSDPRYGMAEPGQPQEIVERSFRKGSDAVLALRRREIDVLDRVNPWERGRLESDGELVVEPYGVPLIHVLVPNRRKPLLAERTFCRALVYALRRDAILKQLLGGREAPGCEVISGPFSPGVGYTDPLGDAYDKMIAPRVYDPRLALTLAEVGLRQVMAKTDQASAKSEKPTQNARPAKTDSESSPPATTLRLPRVVLAYTPGEVAHVACKAIQREWQAIGLTVVLEELPPGPPSRVPDHVDFLYAELAMWEPLVDARRLLGADGLPGACSSYMSLALSQLERSTNWEDVGKRLREIHRIVYDETTVIPLWQLTEHFAFHRSLQGIAKAPATLYESIEQWRPGLYYPTE